MDGGVPGSGRVTTLKSHQSKILHSLIFALYQITVVCGGRHVDRSVSPEMVVWLHLINPVTVD